MSASNLESAIELLRQRALRNWWRMTGALWLTVGLWSLWQLRGDLQLWVEYFTWSAVRYALAYNRLAAIGLGLCVGLTVALLFSESRHILWGLSRSERIRLEQQLSQIKKQGPSHPLWRAIEQVEGRRMG
ncbi:MAG: hypothetical protein AAF152_04880 [Cyanobacteria bacterium P01_A01_bin.114]